LLFEFLKLFKLLISFEFSDIFILFGVVFSMLLEESIETE